jgi:hypothetical protein
VNTLAELINSDHPAVVTLVGDAAPHASWDNKPSWDNWKKTPGTWDNQPSWDNWKKK